MYEVRPATACDATVIQSIYAACISTAEWLPGVARESIDFAKVSAGEVVHVGVAPNGEVKGFVSVQTREPFIHHLYVHHSARSSGVGRQLLASLEEWLPVPWRLKCVRANQQALSFYIRLGWREVAAGESEHGDFAVLEWQ